MVGFLEVLLFCLSLSYIAMNKILNYNPPPIFNVYQRPNGVYWFKVLLSFVILYIRQLFLKTKLHLKNQSDKDKYYENLEKTQQLSNHEQPIDAVYFNAANKNGEHLVAGTARRKGGLIDGFLYVKLNNENVGLLETVKLPDTSLYQKEPGNYFGAEGLKAECLEPMKKWRLSYFGKMRKHYEPSQIVEVELDVLFTSDLPFFNFDIDSDPWSVAKAIALEKWSKEYFTLLKEHHQTHYEQHGTIKGHINVNGATHIIDMDSMRDHTFGNHREWRNLHRYNLQMFATENGDRFTVGNVSFPVTLSNLKMGYVYSADDKKIHPITCNDFELYQHGETGRTPIEYAFTIEAGGKLYEIKVDVIDSPHFFISKDWEAKVIENLCQFQVNGAKGWGASEWQYRNVGGRSNNRLWDSSKIKPVRRLVGLESSKIFEQMLRSS